MIFKQDVLILDDEPLIAMDLAEMVSEAGHTVIGPAFTAREALAESIRTRPTAALLDVNLGKGTSVQVAQHMDAAACPFAFVSAYARIAGPQCELFEAFPDARRFAKPLVETDILAWLALAGERSVMAEGCAAAGPSRHLA